jgi:hypothetical protein
MLSSFDSYAGIVIYLLGLCPRRCAVARYLLFLQTQVTTHKSTPGRLPESCNHTAPMRPRLQLPFCIAHLHHHCHHGSPDNPTSSIRARRLSKAQHFSASSNQLPIPSSQRASLKPCVATAHGSVQLWIVRSLTNVDTFPFLSCTHCVCWSVRARTIQ